jgi:fatty-acyl-CoA synthase
MEYYEQKLDVPILQAWGMTETTPIGTIGRLKSELQRGSAEQRYAIRAKQGFVAAGIDIRIVDDDGREQPWDGRSMGEIQVRGPWVIRLL